MKQNSELSELCASAVKMNSLRVFGLRGESMSENFELRTSNFEHSFNTLPTAIFRVSYPVP